MQKKLFNTLFLAVILCCFTIFLAGCSGDTPSAPTAPSSSDTQTPNIMAQQPSDSPSNSPTSTPTEGSSETSSPSETPTPTPTSQDNPTDSIPSTTGDGIGLSNGTRVNLIVSGQELPEHQAVIIDGEAMINDFQYIFAQLKKASGNENAGIIGILFADNTGTQMRAGLMSDSYLLSITEGEYTLICNLETLPVTVPAQRIDGAFYVPLKPIADAINATVEWDETAQAIKFFY